MSLCLGNFTSDDAGTFSLHNGVTNSSVLFNSILLVKATPVTFVNMTPTPITMTAGQQMIITCETSYCNPPAEITWYMSTVNITNQKNGQTNLYDGLVRTMSTLSINAVKSDNGKHVYCTASNNPGERVNSTVNVLTVLYRPEVTSIVSSPYIVEEGQTVSLSCAVIHANPNTNITWRWFRTDRPFYTLFYGPNYTAPNIERNISGSYSCTARNSVGTSEADVINVDVQYKPDVITRMPSPYTVIEGQKATLECLVTAANPNTSIIWRWFKTDSPSKVLYNGSIYHVHDIQRNMSGLYNCTASNSVGTAEAVTIAVDVLYKPEVISSTPNQYKIIEGRNGTLECLMIAANPNTNIIWKWINTNNPSNVLHNGSAYTISNIHRNRTGLYNCTSTNLAGTSIAVTISVDVMYKPHIIDSPSITVNENERVVLTKEIVSNPLSNVSWYDGSELLLTQYAVRTATFIIQKATCTDTKNFTLIASNTVEGNVSALMEVKVNCKPQSYKTNFTLGVTDTTGIDFSTFVIAYPEPSIKLEYENGSVSDQMMKSISRNAVNNFTIHISQAVLNQSNFGVYRLKVWNSFGEVTMIVNVIPQRKPNSPGNVEIFCEKTSANVQWKSSFNGGDPQLFTIFASNGQQFESELISDRGENEIHSAFIQNLQPSTTYVFYVSAQNSHGLISSERINCTTLKESSNNLPVITGSVAAGGITLAIVVIAVVVVFRRFKKSGSQASNNRIRANEDASHYTTLAERNEHSERNVYDILSQNEGANQYEAYLMKESQETKSQMYESLQKTEVSDKRNICDKQMIAKYTKDVSNIYANQSATDNSAEYINLSFSK
ncbi:carcinoembryonic antigen-related cell adhesion molecule 5-like isoform X4 [Crassostrea angulata]|nr:carcinoembryonic antigen-related cell adhesion molecule 5-like isoform X4 [Crassostrea angulata]